VTKKEDAGGRDLQAKQKGLEPPLECQERYINLMMQNEKLICN